ncbi:hypothetical protein CEXT_28401 [Caerostris extrusa]|uniref:Uncharacterized protein n=1 Tax=Caerostris extrusa TaxID=172846 RepID=A0AAV4TKI1_CAEEX|nr:hypothetical protein CEXT_28401 [Caerostris extrusa]
MFIIEKTTAELAFQRPIRRNDSVGLTDQKLRRPIKGTSAPIGFVRNILLKSRRGHGQDWVRGSVRLVDRS